MKKLSYSVNMTMTNTPVVEIMVSYVDGETKEARTKSVMLCDDDARACLDASGGLKMAMVDKLLEPHVPAEAPPEPPAGVGRPSRISSFAAKLGIKG